MPPLLIYRPYGAINMSPLRGYDENGLMGGLLIYHPYGAMEKIYHGYWLLTCRPYGAMEKIYHGYWLLIYRPYGAMEKTSAVGAIC